MGAALASVRGGCDHGASAATHTHQRGGDPAPATGHHGGHAAGHASLDSHDDGHAQHHGAAAGRASDCCDHGSATHCGMPADLPAAADDPGHGACGTCFCGCTAQVATAALPTFQTALPVFAGHAIARARPAQHSAPTLPHPIRPPIDQA
jgi:hypothetical protein